MKQDSVGALSMQPSGGTASKETWPNRGERGGKGGGMEGQSRAGQGKQLSGFRMGAAFRRGNEQGSITWSVTG